MAVPAVVLPGVDPVTTGLLVLPLMGLYEGSIRLSVLFERRVSRTSCRDSRLEEGTRAAAKGGPRQA